MKLKTRLCVIVISIVVIVVTAVSVLLLRNAQEMQMTTESYSMERLGRTISKDLSRRYETYMQCTIDIAAILSNFDTISAGERRRNIISTMRAIMATQRNVLGVYSCWLPNAVDGSDELFAADATSSETGQFIPWITVQNGSLKTGKFSDGYSHVLKDIRDACTIGNPEQKTFAGRDLFIYTIQAPVRNSRGKLVGVVGMQVDLAATQTYLLSYIEDTESYADVATVELIANNGNIAGHTIEDRVGKHIQEVDLFLSRDEAVAAFSAIQAGKEYSLRVFSPALNQWLYIIYVPLVIGQTDTPWSIMVGCAEEVILDDLRQMLIFTIAVVAVSIILAAFILVLVVSRITKPIMRVALTLKDISEGEGDLTTSIEVNSKDEVGDLARYFNATLEKIKKLILVIKERAAKLSTMGSELSSNVTQTASAVNQITTNIQNIKGRIINQSASVTQTKSTMEQITGNIDKLNEHVEKQTCSVSESSSAIEQMLANIQSVTQTLMKNEENVQQLTEAATIGRQGAQEVSREIGEISKESEGLLEINAVMQNIASQTNLLSMNAAIEAAHAGDAGKGFAVVADEIRKLAESSSTHSKTISAVLQKIHAAIESINSTTGKVLTRFEAIDTQVKTVSIQEENIRNAMKEQSTGSQQILDAIGRLNELTGHVKDSSHEMLEGSREIITEESNLEAVTQEISNGMGEMASGADEINAAVTEIDTISGQTKENINVLVQEVSRFRVE
ncbi:MAG: methyl-accepting chemotaxis protein [Spirochaetales bacterium]|jgi:methyl-accepting chemotaxis protein|nr:methyl-accepting chemotaxis protein [Spirochaetales bacterium]